MAGALTISTLNDDTGVLATQNGMTGICKAWVRFTCPTGTVTVRDSFNISSVTRNSTGNYTISMTTAMANTDYSVIGASGVQGNNSFIGYMTTLTGTITSSSFGVVTSYPSTGADCDNGSVAVFSS
jgi:hypothetical protein